MKKLLLITFFLSFCSAATAGIVYESATGPFDSTTCCGSFANNGQFLGATFSLQSSTSIDGIGGHFLAFNGSGGSIFGALVSLQGSTLPSISGNTLNNVIAMTIFTPTTGADFVAPISTTLGAGNYAIVFGSGLYGTTGNQALTLINPFQAATSSGSVIFGGTSTGFALLDTSGAPNRHRVFLTGGAPSLSVSSPATAWLLGIGMLSLIAVRNFRIKGMRRAVSSQ